jgi:predicted transcriptional regulator
MPFSKFRLRGQQRLSDAVLDSLGDLERSVLEQVRYLQESNVSRVCDALGGEYAYTTIMTTLDRLYKKEILERRKEGKAYIYSPKYSLAEMERGVTADVLDRLFENSIGRVEPVLACIVDSVSDRDRQLLDELERLVKEKRQELDAQK